MRPFVPFVVNMCALRYTEIWFQGLSGRKSQDHEAHPRIAGAVKSCVVVKENGLMSTELR